MSSLDLRGLLRQRGLRATTGRIMILDALTREARPVTIDALRQRLPSPLDPVTLYRALDALADAGLVERSTLGHNHTHYELLVGRPHHHHAICRSCGVVEDIEIPHPTHPETEALSQSTKFSRIDSYTLEFFGRCLRCT